MKKMLTGFVLGVVVALAGAAIAATQTSASLKVSCWSDGTIHVDPAPQ